MPRASGMRVGGAEHGCLFATLASVTAEAPDKTLCLSSVRLILCLMLDDSNVIVGKRLRLRAPETLDQNNRVLLRCRLKESLRVSDAVLAVVSNDIVVVNRCEMFQVIDSRDLLLDLRVKCGKCDTWGYHMVNLGLDLRERTVVREINRLKDAVLFKKV